MQVFSCQFCETSKTTFLTKQLRVIAFVQFKRGLDFTIRFCQKRPKQNIFLSCAICQTSYRVESICIWSFSGPYFPAFGLNTERYSVFIRIQYDCGKIQVRQTPNTDTFYVVSDPVRYHQVQSMQTLSLKNYVISKMQRERTENKQEKEVESLKTNGLCQKCYENICKIVLINHYSPVKGQRKRGNFQPKHYRPGRVF